MQMKEMSIIKGKNGGIDFVSISNPDTGRCWFWVLTTLRKV